MRVNVYAEEVTEEATFVKKNVSDAKFGDRSFYGVRIYLHSPDQLHDDDEDDDRSAVTFFVPWTRKSGHDFAKVRRALNHMLTALDEAESVERESH